MSSVSHAGVAPARAGGTGGEASPAGVRSPGWPAAVIWVVAATALQLFRQPEEPSWNSIWQEDGGVFLTDAVADPLGSILSPYNAYLHLVPRLLADLVALFPLDQAALLISASASVVVALVSVYVYAASGAVLHTQWARVLLAALVVLLPAAGYETNANLANLHWYLTFAAFWVFVARPSTRSGNALGAAIVAAAVLSDPLTGLLLPLAVWHARSARGPWARAVPVAFALTLAVQAVLGVLEDPVRPYADSHLMDVPRIYGLRVVGSVLVGDQFLDDFWQPLGAVFSAPATVLVGVACGFGLARLRGGVRWFVATSLALSVANLAVPLMLRGTENFLLREGFSLNGSRYTVLPILLLITAMIAIVDRLGPRLRRKRWRTLQLGVTALVAFLVLTSYSVFAVRSAGPKWSAELAEAKTRCRETRGVAPRERRPLRGALPGERRSVGEARIPISPKIPQQPFAVVVDCRRIAVASPILRTR